MFEQLPLAALLTDKKSGNRMFCAHAGISSSITKIEDIERLQRPIKLKLGAVSDPVQQTAIDLLWSDPSEKKDALGFKPNPVRDPLE